MNPQPADQKRAERLARQAREKEFMAERLSNERKVLSLALIVAGVVLIITGTWLLLVNPVGGYSEGQAIANIHKLIIGETSAIVGSILLATGLILRYRI